MPKPTMTPREFVFQVAIDAEFRKKYLSNPDNLKADYSISEVDLEGIKKIDHNRLNAELDKIKAGGRVSAGGIITGYHQNSSHESHCKGGDPHCKDSHTKGSSVEVPRDFEKVILPAKIAARIATVTKGPAR